MTFRKKARCPDGSMARYDLFPTSDATVGDVLEWLSNRTNEYGLVFAMPSGFVQIAQYTCGQLEGPGFSPELLAQPCRKVLVTYDVGAAMFGYDPVDYIIC